MSFRDCRCPFEFSEDPPAPIDREGSCGRTKKDCEMRFDQPANFNFGLEFAPQPQPIVCPECDNPYLHDEKPGQTCRECLDWFEYQDAEHDALLAEAEESLAGEQDEW